jgi:hypothetical protein
MKLPPRWGFSRNSSTITATPSALRFRKPMEPLFVHDGLVSIGGIHMGQHDEQIFADDLRFIEHESIEPNAGIFPLGLS